MDLRSHLRAEYRRRSDRNARYSIRAFAQHLGESHSTLLRLLGGRRRLSRPTAERLVHRLGMDPRDADRSLLQEGESAVAGLIARRDFRPDVRWLAVRSGLSIDEVCVVLHELLHARRLTLPSADTWRLEAHE